jgi:hypothetical protein
MDEHRMPAFAQLIHDGVGDAHSFVGGDGDAHGVNHDKRPRPRDIVGP